MPGIDGRNPTVEQLTALRNELLAGAHPESVPSLQEMIDAAAALTEMGSPAETTPKVTDRNGRPL